MNTLKKFKKSDWIMIVASLVIVFSTIFVLERIKSDNTKAEQGTEAPTEADKPENANPESVPGGDDSAEQITI